MDPSQLRRLLREGESSRLDFKSQQYTFANHASVGKRAELLKDVLAMANSWREVEGLILVGIDEVAGQNASVVGIRDHLDDAALQQFINEKLNRPITFSCREFSFDGKTVGVFSVPIQARPFYLLKPFGPLRANAVYYRLGSSTAEADPDEIYEMGRTAATPKSPILRLQFADPRTYALLGSQLQVCPTILKPIPDDELPELEERSTPWTIALPSIDRLNRTYFRELGDYLAAREGCVQLGFVIENQSSVLAEDVRVTFEIDCNEDIMLLERLPGRPERIEGGFRFAGQYVGPPSDVNFARRGDVWKIESEFGKVQPGAKVWTADPLLILIVANREVVLNGNLFADNIDPTPVALTIAAAPQLREMTFQDLQACETEIDSE